MGVKVRNCMNPELVYLREGSRAVVALQPMLRFGVTALPVLDEEERPVGVVSLRDLVDPTKPGFQVSRPVVCVTADEPIEDGGRVLTEANVHHVVVVDEDGRAIGMLSALDVVRGLLGHAPQHPAAISAFESVAPSAHVLVASKNAAARSSETETRIDPLTVPDGKR